MFDRLKQVFSATHRNAHLQEQLQKLREHSPVPVFWLFGKTQSGKTSIIKYLTGANDAEIGRGFRPCTRTSRQYLFPSDEAPLVTFLDTRGLDEPGYDVGEDLARFDTAAHVVIVTVKALDHAQEHVHEQLRRIRAARTDRPIVLALTCLHEAYPQQQHLLPYPLQLWDAPQGDGQPTENGAVLPDWLQPLLTSLAEQSRRFAGLVDRTVPIDLTRPEEGYNDATYGGPALKQVLLDVLPSAYRQTLITLEGANRELQELFAQQALPHIVGYSTLAATAAAFPIPWVDLFVLPAIQTRMVYHLAQLYGQPLSGQRFTELASTLGAGIMVRQAVREMVKVIPYVGSVLSGALAGASTFALGKAFCYYYSEVQHGHIPSPAELKHYYQDQLAEAERWWKHTTAGDAAHKQ